MLIRNSPDAAIAAMFAALVVCASGCEGEGPVTPPPVVAVDAGASRAGLATLSAFKGGVRVEREGAKRAAVAKEPLFIKDAVETDAAGEATITFPDGRTVEMGPEARLVLNEDATGLLLEVQKGLVLSRVPKDARPKPGVAVVDLRILTPFGLTRVGGGESEVAITVGPDAAKVDVTIGEVTFVAKGGEPTTAGAGEKVTATAGGVELLSDQEVTTLEAIQVTILADGKAEVKKAGTKKWAGIGKKGVAVGEGDSVRVRKGSSTLVLGGSATALTLEGGGELLFEKSARAGGREESKVALKKGSLRLKLAQDRKTGVDLGGLQLESDVGGFFTVQKTKNGYAVSALTGELTLKKGEKTQALQAGQQAMVTERGTEMGQVSAKDRPDVVLPSRSGLRVYHPGLREVMLDWAGEEGVYEVRVAQDPRFLRLVAAGQVRQSELAIPIPRRGALFWDVREVASGKTVDSGSAVFAPEPQIKDLERVRNEVPEGSEKTTIYYQDKAPAVTFTYAEEPGAAKYRVEVFRQGQLTSAVAQRTVAEPQAALEAGAIAEGSYVWSVTPLSSAGEPLRGGKMNKLDLVYDNSVPTLLIKSPRNAERATSPLTTSGVAPIGAKLFINGKPVELDEKSRFNVSVTPSGRPPAIVYRVAKPNGPDAFYVRVLKRGGR